MTAAGRGYLSQRYASSLEEWGETRWLPQSGGWLLCRAVPGTSQRDALGGYRHLFCTDWSGLADDLAALTELVSVTAVPDPLAGVSVPELRNAFPDVVRPYKLNYVIDLADFNPSRHHRSKLRKAARRIEPRIIDRPLELDGIAGAWVSLYARLSERHAVSGIGAFSPGALAKQLGVPGCVASVAVYEGRIVSMMIWYAMEDAVHYHLGASSEEGYANSASYALVEIAVAYFAATGARWLNLGAAAGVEADETDGLSRFKSGWTSQTRESYLCGRINDRVSYSMLSGDRPSDAFFPAYRSGSDD